MTLKNQKLITILLSLCLLILIGCFFVYQNTNISYADSEQTKYIYAKYIDTIYQNDEIATNIPNSEIIVYEDETCLKPVFNLPFTYYLKVKSYTQMEGANNFNYYKVEYCGKDYFVKENELTIVKEDGNISYAPIVHEESIDFSPYPKADKTVLTLKDGITIDGIYNQDYTYAFIGSYLDKYYVEATKIENSEKTYLLLDKTNFEDFKLVANAEAVILEDRKPYVPPVIPPKSDSLRIIIIIGIAVPAVLILLLIFMPRKKVVKEEEDFMSTKTNDFDYDRERKLDPDIKDDTFKDRPFKRK